MLTDLKNLAYICSVEVPRVILRAQSKKLNKPVRGLQRHCMIRMGFLFSRGSEVPKDRGEAKLGYSISLDQVTSVLGDRKPRRQICFSGGSFSFFSFHLLLGLVVFPFLSFKITC